MKNIEILKNYIENNNGIILASDIKKLNVHKQYLKLLCDEGYVERKEKGVYVKKGKNINDFFLIQQRYKTGIFSHNTALYFYHLTDRTPIKYDMTFKNNIRVNAVSPGVFWTPIQPSCWEAEKIPTLGSDAPMGRAGHPYEIAPIFIYLASDDSSYVTGQVIHVNGGEYKG